MSRSATRPGRMNVAEDVPGQGNFRNVTPALLKNRYPTEHWPSRYWQAVYSWR